MGERVLGGGAVNEVVRVGATARRTSHERSGYVRELLKLFEGRGWAGAPHHLGTDERGREVFGYLEGRAAVTSRERVAACTDAALVRVAQLVRGFHDLTHGTPLAGDRDAVCHNDLAPKDTVYAVDGAEWRPTAFIDWDLAAPGERVHDLAHVCWGIEAGVERGEPAMAALREHGAVDEVRNAYAWVAGHRRELGAFLS